MSTNLCIGRSFVTSKRSSARRACAKILARAWGGRKRRSMRSRKRHWC